MWRFQVDKPAAAIIRARLSATGSGMSFAEVIAAWRDDPAFRTFWTASLRAVPFEAYCFETAPLHIDSLDRPIRMRVRRKSCPGACDTGPGTVRRTLSRRPRL